jgi:hypothetical protein
MATKISPLFFGSNRSGHTERERERENLFFFSRKGTPDNGGGRLPRGTAERRHSPEANFRTRRTGQRWKRRMTEAPDDGRRTTEKFQICTERDFRERERSSCEMKNLKLPRFLVFGFLAAWRKEKKTIFYYCHVGVLWRSCEADVYRSFLLNNWWRQILDVNCNRHK